MGHCYSRPTSFAPGETAPEVDKAKIAAGQTPVYVHVYELAVAAKVTTSIIGAGIYHTGVQVYEDEYCYSGHNQIDFRTHQELSGLRSFRPPRDSSFIADSEYHSSIIVGYSSYSESEVVTIFASLHAEFTGASYNPLHRNCNTFTCAFIEQLLQLRPGDGISVLPAYVQRVVGAAKSMRLCMPKMLTDDMRSQAPKQYMEKNPKTGKMTEVPASLIEQYRKNRAIAGRSGSSSNGSNRPVTTGRPSASRGSHGNFSGGSLSNPSTPSAAGPRPTPNVAQHKAHAAALASPKKASIIASSSAPAASPAGPTFASPLSTASAGAKLAGRPNTGSFSSPSAVAPPRPTTAQLNAARTEERKEVLAKLEKLHALSAAAVPKPGAAGAGAARVAVPIPAASKVAAAHVDTDDDAEDEEDDDEKVPHHGYGYVPKASSISSAPRPSASVSAASTKAKLAPTAAKSSTDDEDEEDDESSESQDDDEDAHVAPVVVPVRPSISTSSSAAGSSGVGGAKRSIAPIVISKPIIAPPSSSKIVGKSVPIVTPVNDHDDADEPLQSMSIGSRPSAQSSAPQRKSTSSNNSRGSSSANILPRFASPLDGPAPVTPPILSSMRSGSGSQSDASAQYWLQHPPSAAGHNGQIGHQPLSNASSALNYDQSYAPPPMAVRYPSYKAPSESAPVLLVANNGSASRGIKNSFSGSKPVEANNAQLASSSSSRPSSSLLNVTEPRVSNASMRSAKISAGIPMRRVEHDVSGSSTPRGGRESGQNTPRGNRY